MVFPSEQQFGLVAAESLACGRPVVATRSGGPEDIIKKGQGYLVTPKDPEALGDALIRVLGREGISGADELADSAFLRQLVLRHSVMKKRDMMDNSKFKQRQYYQQRINEVLREGRFI